MAFVRKFVAIIWPIGWLPCVILLGGWAVGTEQVKFSIYIINTRWRTWIGKEILARSIDPFALQPEDRYPDSVHLHQHWHVPSKYLHLPEYPQFRHLHRSPMKSGTTSLMYSCTVKLVDHFPRCADCVWGRARLVTRGLLQRWTIEPCSPAAHITS